MKSMLNRRRLLSSIATSSSPSIVPSPNYPRKAYNSNTTVVLPVRTNTAYHNNNITTPYIQMSTSTNNTSTTTNTKVTKSHYEAHSAESYDSAFFYEVGPYMKHLRNLCYDRLQLQVQGDWNLGKSTTSTTTTTTTTTSSTTSYPSLLNPKRRILLDIGGGTGTFTRTLITSDTDSCTDNYYENDENNNINKPNIEAIVIDPYLEFNTTSLETTESNNIIRFIKAPAEAFILKKPSSKATTSNDNDNDNDVVVVGTTTEPSNDVEVTQSSSIQQPQQLPQQYHQILMKEVIHHFTDIDRPAIFHGLYHSGLIPTVVNTTTSPASTTTNNNTPPPPIPSILIITRPQIDIDYPLWDAAKDVWAQNQPSVTTLIHELELAGFTHITHTIESYPCAIPLQRWCTMIQNRFWSTFTNFTDDELQLACQHITINEKHRITDDGIIHFDDRLVFITACKI